MSAHVPVVLLHPFPFDAGFWNALREHLPAEQSYEALNAPGFGGRPLPVGWQISDWADEVADTIAETEAGKAIVCGLSMGGYAALALVTNHPDRVAGLVLADTRAEADTPEARNARTAQMERIAGGDLAGWATELLDKAVSPSVDPTVKETLRTSMIRQDPSCVTEALRALRDRPARVDDLTAITVPTVVVVGADDEITPRDAAETLVAGISGAKLVVIPDAGHLSAVEQPEAFADAIADLPGIAA